MDMKHQITSTKFQKWSVAVVILDAKEQYKP